MILKELKIQVWEGHITNCYVIYDDKTNETMVIDPGAGVDRIKEMIEILGGELKYIYLTHCHCDHIGGAQELKQKCGGKILVNRYEVEGLKNKDINRSGYNSEVIEFEPDMIVDDKDLLHLGDLQFEVIHTPGHTAGGSCLYCKEEEMLFSGDTLFRGTWGRTDLPTGGMEAIMNSITNKLLKLPEATIVYPGHGKPTKIGEEKPIYLELKPRKMQ